MMCELNVLCNLKLSLVVVWMRCHEGGQLMSGATGMAVVACARSVN